MPLPNFLHYNREPGCWAVLADRKFYFLDDLIIKRTLRRHEWTELRDNYIIKPSAALPQRFRTDVAVQRYLREHTNIPLPEFICAYEDDGAMYLVSRRVPGVLMMDLPTEEERMVVDKELRQHIKTLKALHSDTPGVPGEVLMIPPQRVCDMHWKLNSTWRPRSDVRGDFVFCHNDLGQHNVLVDPETLKITAIIDWEFGGFWPEWFEREFWTRRGHSYALEGEEDDTERCREWLLANFDEVEQAHLPTLQDKLSDPASKPGRLPPSIHVSDSESEVTGSSGATSESREAEGSSMLDDQQRSVG